MATVHSSQPIAPATNQGWLRAIVGAIPNLLVLGMLFAIFVAGHHYGWKLPRFSALFGSAAGKADDWCDEHLVPESTCLECNAALKSPGKPLGWCPEHGVAECVICHPELAQIKGPPALPAYDTAAAIGVRPRAANNSVSTLHTKVVQIASPEAVDKAGIAVDVVGTGPMREEIVASGEAEFDPTRVAHLSPRVAGTVWQVYKHLGERVAAGDVLALIDAAAVGQAKTELLQAVASRQARQANVDRLRGIQDILANKGQVEAEAALREAEIKVVSAKQSLVNLGFPIPAKLADAEAAAMVEEIHYLGIPDALIQTVKERTQTANLLPLLAPTDGVIVKVDIVRGEVVDTTTPAFVVAEPSRLCLNLHVRQEDAPLVQVGQRVQFETESQPRAAEGQIDWISPAVDHKSRTLPIRVTLDNSAGKLRDSTFGVGRIVLREEPRAIVVPKGAVQTAEGVQFVFVRDKRYFEKDSPKFFHVRQVRVGATSGKQVELLAGVLPGEVVATSGSNVLLAQLLRANLGAGCGCHDGK